MTDNNNKVIQHDEDLPVELRASSGNSDRANWPGYEGAYFSVRLRAKSPSLGAICNSSFCVTKTDLCANVLNKF